MKRLVLAATAVLAPLPAAAQDSTARRVQSQTSFTNLADVVESLYNALIIFLPAVAIIYLALSGYRYIIAQGNPDLTDKAKRSLTYAVFGVIIAFASAAIMTYAKQKLGFSI